MYVYVSQLLRVFVCYCTSLYVSVSHCQSQRVIQPLCILSGFVSLYMCVWASVCMFQLFRMYVIVSELLGVFVCDCTSLYMSVSPGQSPCVRVPVCISYLTFCQFVCFRVFLCINRSTGL